MILENTFLSIVRLSSDRTHSPSQTRSPAPPNPNRHPVALALLVALPPEMGLCKRNPQDSQNDTNAPAQRFARRDCAERAHACVMGDRDWQVKPRRDARPIRFTLVILRRHRSFEHVYT